MDQSASMELVLLTPPETERSDSEETASESFLGENRLNHVLSKLRGAKYRERSASWGRIADSSDLAIVPNSVAAYKYCLSKAQSDQKPEHKPDADGLIWGDLNKLQRAAIIRDGLPGPHGVGMLPAPRCFPHRLQTPRSPPSGSDAGPEVRGGWSQMLTECIDSIKVFWVGMVDIGVVMLAILGVFYVLGFYPVE